MDWLQQGFIQDHARSRIEPPEAQFTTFVFRERCGKVERSDKRKTRTVMTGEERGPIRGQPNHSLGEFPVAFVRAAVRAASRG